jgi:hypothetical protein
MSGLLPITLADQIAEVERELKMRAKVYPGWVFAGRLTKEKADWNTAVLEAVLGTLKAIEIASQRGPAVG